LKLEFVCHQAATEACLKFLESRREFYVLFVSLF